MAPPAFADTTLPDRPVRIVVGFTPGGGSDTAARIVAPRLSELWDQKVLIENRAGAGGRIASEFVAKARPDGTTLLFASPSLTIDAALYKDLPFDPIRSFAPISLVTEASFIIVVHPSLPVHSVSDLIALAKQEPGKLSAASGGPGSVLDLATRLFCNKAGVDIVSVAYQGAVGLTDVVAGRVQLSITGIPQTQAFIKSGQLRALAVTASHRSPVMPELPTVAESGLPGYVVAPWYGALAPAGVPPAILDKLNRDLTQVLTEPVIRDRFASQGLEAHGTTQTEFARMIASDIDTWRDVVRAANLTAD
jgi:tripartite-type tricarboxylate transporter receptor subunit TctC